MGFAAVAAWLCVAAAHAQTTYFRDGHGRTTGRAEPRGDTTYYRDESGRTAPSYAAQLLSTTRPVQAPRLRGGEVTGTCSGLARSGGWQAG